MKYSILTQNYKRVIVMASTTECKIIVEVLKAVFPEGDAVNWGEEVYVSVVTENTIDAERQVREALEKYLK